MNTKPASPGNPQMNSTKDIIHQKLGDLLCTYNLQEIYVYDADPLMGILAAESLSEQSTYHIIKGKSSVHLVFGQDMILPIAK